MARTRAPCPCRALERTDASTSERFLRLQDVALQQCQETDESDLQRLRKHFKTLKNTFTVYDLKEGFIDGGLAATIPAVQKVFLALPATTLRAVHVQDCCKDCPMVLRRSSYTSLRKKWRGTVSCSASISPVMSRYFQIDHQPVQVDCL